MKSKALVGLAFAISLAAAPSASLAEQWKLFSGPEHAFTVELPVDSFDVTDQSTTGLELTEVGGSAVISIFARGNPQRLSAAAFAETLSKAGQIEDVTYRAGGKSWFVLSGHYRGASGEEGLIYYTKFLVSADRARVFGFEISYLPAEKRRLDAVIDRIEATFHPQ